MPTSLKELKRLLKECKQVLRYLRKLYKSGAVLRMLHPLAELNNAEEQVKYYTEQINKRKAEDKEFKKKWKKYTTQKNK